MYTDIRHKTVAQFANEVKEGKTDTKASTTDWQADGWKQTFFVGFWQLFGQKVTGGTLKMDALRCADVIDVCEQIKAVNLVVENYLTESNKTQSAGSDTKEAKPTALDEEQRKAS